MYDTNLILKKTVFQNISCENLMMLEKSASACKFSSLLFNCKC